MAKIPFRAEVTDDVATDRAQRLAQQTSQKVNSLAGRYVAVAISSLALSANVTTASASFADLTGFAVSFAAVAGDVLLVDCAVMMANSAAALAQIRAVVVDGNATTQVGNTGTDPSSSTLTVAVSGVYTVVTGGTVTVKMQGLAAGAGTLTVSAGASGGSPTLRVQQLRAV